jgi:alkylation response protein AidB-like acyl-CoA dehydrogenase
MEATPATARIAQIVALADALADRTAARAAIHDREGTFPHASYVDLNESGYLRLVLPSAYGGMGASVAEMVHAQMHLARGDGATALAAGMLVQLLGRVIEDRAWPEPILAEVCRTIAAEGGLINTIVTEPELGSISRGGVPRTTFTPAPGGWLINGQKIFATGAPALRFMAVGGAMPPSADAPHGATATAIVRADAPGIRIVPTRRDGLGMRTAANDDIFFADVFVPDAWLIGRKLLGGAPPAHPAPLNAWTLTIAAVYLGIGQAACAAACHYAHTRRPPSLSGPIADLPHIQQMIGQMQLELTAAEAVLTQAANAWVADPAQRPTLSPQIAAAKYLATNAACRVSEMALRVAGGFSLTRDLPLERYFRDARAGLFNPPQDDLALTIIGSAALATHRPTTEV